MKIYISCDQEGVACVFSRRENYLYAAEYATMEIVAICNALLEVGVDEIFVNSVHNIEYHKLPKGVRIFHGLPAPDRTTVGLDASYDAVFRIGQHAMAGGREKGCWRHTGLPHPISRAYSSVAGVWINDTLVGETGLLAAFAGIHDVPLVYLSGDRWACEEAEELIPGCNSIAVKEGTSYFSAISMTPEAAAEASAVGAVGALDTIESIKPYKVAEPTTITVEYLFPERATDAITAVAGAVRVDERTVSVTYPTVAELRDHQGFLRVPELEVYAEDLGVEQTTTLFTRLGGEPYERKPNMPLPKR